MEQTRKYQAGFLMGFQKTLEYRADFLLSLLSSIFPIVIQVSVWQAIYRSTGSGSMYGYTYHQMLAYTFLVGILSKFLATGFEYEINDDIKNGGLNKYLVKPVNYYLYRISCFLGGRLSALLLFGIVLILILGILQTTGFVGLSIVEFLCFLGALLLTLMLNFSVFFCISMSGFWLSEVARLFPAVSIVFTVISGGIFPLDVLGTQINRILSLLPFKYMLQFPTDIITGRLSIDQISSGLLFQGIWGILFLILSMVLWKKGLKQYTAIGG